MLAAAASVSMKPQCLAGEPKLKWVSSYKKREFGHLTPCAKQRNRNYVPAAMKARIRSALNAASMAFAIGAAGCASDPVYIQEAYPYKAPLSSPGQKFSSLPPAVQASVRAQVGGAQMRDIERTDEFGRMAYKITFEEEGIYPPLYVAPDGSVLYPQAFGVAVGAGNEDFGVVSGKGTSGLKLTELPAKVVTTIQESAPAAEVAYVQQLTVGGRVSYEVRFKDQTAHPPIVVDEGGLLVK